MSQLPGTVDDAFATVQLLHSPEVTVVGVSSCFGNAMVGDVTSSAQRLLDRHFPSLGINVASGAAGPADIVVGTHAVASLARALALSADSEAKVDIVALGPLTNVAGLVSQHPELIPRIGKVYFVAGRTPGERFHIGTANIDTLADMNFEKDAAACGGAPVRSTRCPGAVQAHHTRAAPVGRPRPPAAKRVNGIDRAAAGALAGLARRGFAALAAILAHDVGRGLLYPVRHPGGRCGHKPEPAEV